jgi:hypothetical protein
MFGFAGFQDDFNLFAKRGSIGAIGSIELPLQSPEIGTTCSIIFNTGGEIGLVVINDDWHLVVHDAQEFNFLAIEESYLIKLFINDECVDEAQIKPLLIIPELNYISLPDEVDYSAGEIQFDIFTKDASEMRVFYRTTEDNAWQAAQVEYQKTVVLQLEKREYTITVRVELKSRHASLSDRATQVYEENLRIMHPAVQAQCNLNTAPPIFRYQEDLFVLLKFKWAKLIRIEYLGQTEEYLIPDPEKAFCLSFPINSQIIGKQSILVEMISLADEYHYSSCNVDVLPRKVECEILDIEKRSKIITIKGSSEAYLVIPSRQVKKTIPLQGCTLTHHYLMDTIASIHIIDDVNNKHVHRFTLAAPTHRFLSLPQLSY